MSLGDLWGDTGDGRSSWGMRTSLLPFLKQGGPPFHPLAISWGPMAAPPAPMGAHGRNGHGASGWGTGKRLGLLGLWGQQPWH